MNNTNDTIQINSIFNIRPTSNIHEEAVGIIPEKYNSITKPNEFSIIQPEFNSVTEVL